MKRELIAIIAEVSLIAVALYVKPQGEPTQFFLKTDEIVSRAGTHTSPNGKCCVIVTPRADGLLEFTV